MLLAILDANRGSFPQVCQLAALPDNGLALFLIHGGPLADNVNRGSVAARLPSAREGIFNGCHYFTLGDVSPALGNLSFEQPHNFTGWQVGVKLPRNTKQPGVDALTGPGGTGQQVA